MRRSSFPLFRRRPGAVPPKKGFKWESEKVAEWRLKARHDGLDENERLLYQDYQQTLALAEADANASDAKFTGSHRRGS